MVIGDTSFVTELLDVNEVEDVDDRAESRSYIVADQIKSGVTYESDCQGARLTVCDPVRCVSLWTTSQSPMRAQVNSRA
jgi:hypothetical protein